MIETSCLSQRFEIWPFHLDGNGQYPAHELLIRLVHTAELHAAREHFGVETLQREGLTWILNRIAIRYSSPLRTDLPFEIETGILETHRISSLRGFLIRQQAEVIASSLSKWSVLDLESRRPVEIPEKIRQCMGRGRLEGDFLPSLKGQVVPPIFTERHRRVYSRTVRYSDLDLNGHVNSAVWLSMALDALPLQRWDSQTLTSLDIHFASEAHPADQLEVFLASEQEERESRDYITIRRGVQPCLYVKAGWIHPNE